MKIYHDTKNKRLNNILSWLEFHVRSTFYNWNAGYYYHYINNTLDLLNDVNEKNVFLIDKYFQKINEYVEKYNVKYLWTWCDLKNYNEKYLAY